MKTISASLQTHLERPVTTLALCVRIQRTDGQVFGYTDHDQDLVFNSVTYRASTGQRYSAAAASDNLGVDNAELIGFLDSNNITEQDIAARLWDRAQIEVFEVNWLDPDGDGALTWQAGTLGEVSRTFDGYVAEIRGPSQRWQQTIGEVLTPTCRTRLGDTRCKVNLASFTVTGTITAVTDRRVFTDSARTEAAAYFAYGQLTFTSGNNNNRRMEVKKFSAGGQFELFEALAYDVTVGDSYSVYAGCNKLLATCQTKFSNANNFQGEPNIPGQDELFRYGRR